MANGIQKFVTTLFPGTSAFFAPPAVAEPSIKNLQKAVAYVDPSRLLTGWTQLPYNPSWLVTRKGLQIYDTMRRDEQVKAALKFKIDSVLAPGWEVVSPGDQEEDWEVTRFVRDVLAFIPEGWNTVLTSVLSALAYGFSCSERIYAEAKAGEWKGKLLLTRAQSLRPNYVDFVTDPFGVLLGITQQITGSVGETLPPAKFVLFSYTKEFGNYYGTSDLEACYRPWWVKDNAYKWLAVTLERFSMAPLFALYDPNAYGGGLAAELQKVLKNIQNATFGAIPRASKDALELWSQNLNKGSSELFLLSIDRFDQHIARAILVPDLVGMSSNTGQTGSLARSQTNADSFMQVVKQLQNDVAAQVMNAQVIPQLCDLNFPSLASYPVFKFMSFTDAQRLEIMNTWAAMVGGQVVNKIEDDEVHIRKVLGFPENENPEVLPNPTPPGGGGMPGEPGASPFGGPAKKPPTSVQTLPAAGKPGETPLKGETKVVAAEELSTEMREFAVENDAVWVVGQGGQWVAIPVEEENVI